MGHPPRAPGLIARALRAAHLGTAGVLLAAALLQAGSFFLIARGLGPADFGRFVVLSAVTQFLIEAVALGSGEALIRRTARDASQFAASLGHALIMTSLTAVAFAALALAAIGLVSDDVATTAIVVFVFGELVGVRLTALSEHAFIARSRVADANWIRLLGAAARLATVLIAFQLFDLRGVREWALCQGLATLAVGLVAMIATCRVLGRPTPAWHRDDLLFGAQVSATQLAAMFQFTADRYVMSLLAAPAVVGAYAVAARSAQFAFLPVQAILRNLYARFFAVGASGIDSAVQFARGRLPTVLGVGAVVGVGLYFAADLLPVILGPAFAETAGVARSLCVLPLLRGLQSLNGDALSGAGYQAQRTWIGVGASLLFLPLLAVLVTAYGVWGAVAALYAHQVAVLLSFAAATRMLARRERSA